MTPKILTDGEGATVAPNIVKDSKTSSILTLDVVRMKWIKTVFWELNTATLSLAQVSRWGTILALILFTFSAIDGLVTYTVKSSIKAINPLFLLITPCISSALKIDRELAIAEILEVGLLGQKLLYLKLLH